MEQWCKEVDCWVWHVNVVCKVGVKRYAAVLLRLHALPVRGTLFTIVHSKTVHICHACSCWGASCLYIY